MRIKFLAIYLAVFSGFLTCPAFSQNTVPLGNLNWGVTVNENATDLGYLLFNPSGLSERLTLYNGQAENFAVVFFENEEWFYYENEISHPFTPAEGDLLIAELDFDNTDSNLLIDQTGFFEGIEFGYESGDLSIINNWWNGVYNPNEFSLSGTYITPNPLDYSSLGNLGLGVTVNESATGSGYLLFNPSGLSERLTLYNGQAENFAVVFFENEEWFYYENEISHPFTPAEGDLLIAELDFDNTDSNLLIGQTGFFEGIEFGYESGDLSIINNWWNGVFNPNEFSLNGSFIIETSLSLDSIKEHANELTIDILKDESGVGNVFTSYSYGAQQAENFAAVFFSTGQWFYYENEVAHAFNPAEGDLLVAELDFDNTDSNLLIGQTGFFEGIEFGYESGDLSIINNQWNEIANDNEYGLAGTFLESNDLENYDLGDLAAGVTVKEDAQGVGFLLFNPAGLSDRMSLFGRGEVELDQSSWAYNFNLTGIAWDKDQAGTLVSPRHVLMAHHFQRSVGDVLDFHDDNGTMYSATLIDKQSVPGGLNPDITVGLLDQEVPLPFYRVLPPRDDWHLYLNDALVISTHHTRHVSVREISSVSGKRIWFRASTQLDPSLYTSAISGTSGHPIFITIDNQSVLVGTFTFGGDGGGPFISNSSNFNDINNIMMSLGGGYQLETIDVAE